MAVKIEVNRNYEGGVEITFTYRSGFVAIEYLTDDQQEELIAKLQGTWTRQDEAKLEFETLTTEQVQQVADLDGDSRRRELAREELENRSEEAKDQDARIAQTGRR